MIDKFLIGYLLITLLLEILDIIFFFTPSPNDELILEKVKGFWFNFGKYFLFFSARTPILLLFSFGVTILEFIDAFIKKKFKK